MFIGQNPSADFREDYPTLGEARSDDPSRELFEYFESRFDGWSIRRGTEVRLRKPVNGKDYAASNQFLGRVKDIAEALYGPEREVIPGVDYALTEAVRCKSKDAIGVEQAIATCAVRYLKDTVDASSARIIVCMGLAARLALLTVYAGATLGSPAMRLLEKKHRFNTAEPMSALAGDSRDSRWVVFVQHSGAFGKLAPLDSAIVAKLRPLL